MGEDKDTKTNRILTIFDRLNKGEAVNKRQLAAEMLVNEKTIQRDIDDIRAFYSERYETYGNIELQYNAGKKGYCLVGSLDDYLRNDEILAISKVLLDSRAFNKAEFNALLDKLIMQASPADRKLIKDVIANERFHYVHLQHNAALLENIWQLSSAIRQRKLLNIRYMRMGQDELVERIVKPVGIIFSEYYFYLTAFINGTDYDYPTLYRIDRIRDYSIMKETFHVSEGDRFEEGEFRKRIQFMYPGELMKIRFKYWGESIEAVLDRLPTARIIGQEMEKNIVEAEVFGIGIKMWLLSQGERIEVIAPESFRLEMKSAIQAMNDVYG